MNLVEAMQMSRVDGYTEGFDACKRRVIEGLKHQMGDRSCGEDMRAHYDAVLAAAIQRVEQLYAGSPPGGIQCEPDPAAKPRPGQAMIDATRAAYDQSRT